MKNSTALIIAVIFSSAFIYSHSQTKKEVYETPPVIKTEYVEPKPIVEQKPVYAESSKSRSCLRQALYYEARGENLDGMLAVASVIINRKESKHYPNTFCKVIHQRLQFSYVDEFKKIGKPLKINASKLSGADLHAYKVADQIAKEMVAGQFTGVLPKSVMWYARHEVSNYWTVKMKKVSKVGDHVFYASN